MKFKFIITALFFLSIASFSQKLPQLGKDKVEDVISAMTIDEKIYILMGLGYPPPGEKSIEVGGFPGRTWDIPRLGITTGVLADGPAGLRIEAHKNNRTYFCTAFPTGTNLASTWNVDLVEEVGKAMGNEVLEYGCDVLLAPAMNIHRNPLCGRNFEYYSEDPLITGKIGASIVKGVQSNGVGTSIKHFIANNEETSRGFQNEVISQRALREIYLRGFEIAVKEAKPWTVMTSYNRVNGYYTSENRDLITSVLRNEWGFLGMVMSDWAAGADAVAQMYAGNDILMPGCEQRKELLKAYKNKAIDEKTFDKNITRILNFIMQTPRFKGYKYSCNPDLENHSQIALKAATESMVLLKNEKNTLPIKGNKLALFGKTSYHLIVGGTGSGEVNFKHAVSLKEGLANVGFKMIPSLDKIYQTYIDSVTSNLDEATTKKVADFMSDPSIAKDKTIDFLSEMPISKEKIEQQVKSSDIAIVTIGRNSGEGRDRKESDFSLSEIEKDLIKNVSKVYHSAGKKVVVILNIGGVIEVDSWRDYPDAILLAWQAGQEGGNALADVLKGTVSPSGKLTMSFPLKYEDVPSANFYHGVPKEYPQDGFYEEGIYVGYRYYQTYDVKTAYEFGYGLSYSNFEYSNIKLSSNTFSDSLKVTLNVKNIGKNKGKEVVQLYLNAPKNEIDKPIHELKAFVKTKDLKSEENQEITFILNKRSLASFWSGMSAWVADKGTYNIEIGSSSKDIRQKVSFELPQTIIVEQLTNVLYPNKKINEFTGKN